MPVLSSDETRRLLSGDPENQSIHKEVFALMRRVLRLRLKLGCPVTAIDATNLTKWERRQWVKIARDFGARAEAVYFDVPASVCQKRNARRRRVVPAAAIEAMVTRLTAPEKAEGFHRINVLGASSRPRGLPVRQPGDRIKTHRG